MTPCLSTQISFMRHSKHLSRIIVTGFLSTFFLAACGKQEPAAEKAAASPPELSTPAQAQTTGPIEAASEVMTEANYRRHVETLASDEFGGRAPASKGEELTVDYLVQNFKSMGLAPGNGDSYTQDVPLAWVETTNSPDLVFSGGKDKDMTLTYSTEQVLWSRRQVTEVAIENSEMVFVGYGINAPERDWNDYAGIDVTGKTVVMLINDPGFPTQDSELFNGNTMTYYGRWDYKFAEAARQGAAGAIMIHDTLPAAYGWDTVANSWTGRQFDMVLEDKGAGLAAVEGWITREKADALFAKAGLNLDDMYAKAQQPGFTAVPMNVTVSASLVSKTEVVNSKNVAAFLKGSEAPDEIFIYMAHWDHLGTDTDLEGDQIYNGALDNASGTAALLEIARAYASLPQAPRRSVLFLSVTAEEQGLLGSRYYALNPLYPLTSTVGGINMDGMNNFGATRDITVVGLGMSDLDTYLTAAAAAQERVVNGDRESEKGYYYRSDHFELAKEGVPMLFPWGGYDDREKGIAYGMEKAKEYNKDHYHRVSDEYDLSWVVSGALEDMNMYFKAGLEIANSDDWPNWKEGTEFKATRDAQMKDQH
jgi:Zn-dependent M28 family amino/carboxypeptidase